ncbi:MAG: DNA-directed RNA polymerase subunit beta' [Bacteroidota bacterium]|nr:DNA-directed RNA polymerase subunit beta' [Candidatus Kapabacteria bacterium]MDW8220802.1 DNA-directed RNA polymerase subunit beta' [Bacteroidota bacterium]
MQSRSIPRKGFSRVSIRIASSDEILHWSRGEVTKPETINYRSFRPEKDGLFCEKIFGPVRDWECACGKYKRIRYKGIVCDRCGVEVTQKSVRRERMGHITLAVPVVHVWFLRSQPSKIAAVIGLPAKDIERIVYYESYIVVQPGSTGLQAKDLLTEEEYLRIMDSLKPEERNLDDDDPKKFIALIGGEAIKELLKRVNPDKEAGELREMLKEEISQQKKAELLKRLRILEAFRDRGDGRVPNDPSWMVLDVVPVIPPELRPLVPLEGGRFATSDLNDLYRRVIIRNNRLKRLIDIKAPEVILRNEKRMLQEAVDSLFDNSRRSTARAESQRTLKSLSDMLKGKTGRFRQNLLGKRVDYSGRSVIVVGPTLKIWECGLPKDMAVELFKPFIIRRLIERGHVKTVKSAKKMVERKTTEVWDILEQVIQGHPVLLNRAPTLHRLGIQAFQPRLIEGKAIRLHPLVCTAFNADFDGDQMAVHVPLSHEAQLEALLLMLASHNILHTQNGTPITVPSQDMVLGCYYLTKMRRSTDEEKVKGEGMIFYGTEELIIAYNNGAVDMHACIKVRINGQIIETTTGRVLFNQIVPKEVGFLNEALGKGRLRDIIGTCFQKAGMAKTVEFLDALKEIGFATATRGGLSVSIEDLIIPAEKAVLIEAAQKDIDKVEANYQAGVITSGERYNKIVDIWSSASSRIADRLYTELQRHKQGFNTFLMMLESQARGSKEQIRQLAGMRGLMAKPKKSISGSTGELIENPIISNFKEGLSILEYFISTHGARKGLADTALKTADAGYLTRRLHDVAQDIIISEEDCGTIRGVELRAIKDGEEVKESLYERILGRVSLYDITDPLTGELLARKGEMIDEDIASKIQSTAIESVFVRSVLTCESRHGICTKCYGRNLATARPVDVGEAVGTIAAQSIGEPGTQLTLRTFHTGGTAALITAQSNITAKFDGIIQFDRVKTINAETEDSYGMMVNTRIVVSRGGLINIIEPDSNRILTKYEAMYGAQLHVHDGQVVKKGELIYEWDPYNNVIITEYEGYVRYRDVIENVTYREENDEQTGHRTKTIIESRDRAKLPQIVITDEQGKELKAYNLPTNAQLTVEENDYVSVGMSLAKIPRDSGKTRDITGGLPRVTELFEARSPQKAAIVSEIDGTVHLDSRTKRGSRSIRVVSFDGVTEKVYTVSFNKYIVVQDGDTVRAGDPLTDGSIDPHDILRIKGSSAVQQYLVNEIQEVYRMQGVKINDKHIEVIVRQMLQKNRIIDPGDSQFLEGDQVDRVKFLDENERLKDMVVITDKGDSKFNVNQIVHKKRFREVNAELKKKGKALAVSRPAEPAIGEPILLGITQAALNTESFISAASFQETTRVLTEAAIAAKSDYLVGLKENIILGQLIPAGTGLRRCQDIVIHSEVGNIFDHEEYQLNLPERLAAPPPPPPTKGRRRAKEAA